MSDAEYLQSLAARCLRLARSCFDLGIAGELRAMASELEHKAATTAPHQDGAVSMANARHRS